MRVMGGLWYGIGTSGRARRPRERDGAATRPGKPSEPLRRALVYEGVSKNRVSGLFVGGNQETRVLLVLPPTSHLLRIEISRQADNANGLRCPRPSQTQAVDQSRVPRILRTPTLPRSHQLANFSAQGPGKLGQRTESRVPGPRFNLCDSWLTSAHLLRKAGLAPTECASKSVGIPREIHGGGRKFDLLAEPLILCRAATKIVLCFHSSSHFRRSRASHPQPQTLSLKISLLSVPLYPETRFISMAAAPRPLAELNDQPSHPRPFRSPRSPRYYTA